MRVFGYEIAVTKAGVPITGRPLGIDRPSAWFPIVREPYTGAWQENQEITAPAVLGSGAVFACTTLIASDIGKLGLYLVREDTAGIWTRTESAAFSPVLRKPNRYQTRQKFIEQWITSKLIHGNTYVLKERDARGVVVALYVLNPQRVTPLIADDGAVYYRLQRDPLAPYGDDADAVTVPAKEIIHDLMVALYHPLCGVSPITACGLPAIQGLAIQGNSRKFFANGSQPGGILIAPGAINSETAGRLKEQWETAFTGDNVGKVALLSDGLKYEPLSVNAEDAQLIEQLNWTGATIASCFHVPAYMVGIGAPPPFATIEPLVQAYYAQCLQTLIVALETNLDEGLALTRPIDGVQYGVEIDVDDLIWTDTIGRTKAAGDAISSGSLSPNESRKKYHGVGGVPGGESPYLQQQMYSLAALAKRDASAPPPPSKPPGPAVPPPLDDGDDETAKFAAALMRKVLADAA